MCILGSTGDYLVGTGQNYTYQRLTYKGFDLLTGLNNYLTEVLTTSYVFPKSATITN